MVEPKGPFSSLPDTAGAPRQIPGWDPSTNKRKRVGVPMGPSVRRDCIVCMGPVTPPVDSRAPVCARLDRVRVRVLGEPRGICAIRPCARDLCACVCPGARSVCVYARMRALHLCAGAGLFAWWSRSHGVLTREPVALTSAHRPRAGSKNQNGELAL